MYSLPRLCEWGLSQVRGGLNWLGEVARCLGEKIFFFFGGKWLWGDSLWLSDVNGEEQFGRDVKGSIIREGGVKRLELLGKGARRKMCSWREQVLGSRNWVKKERKEEVRGMDGKSRRQN